MTLSLPLLYHKLKKKGFFGSKTKDRSLLNEVLEIIDKQVIGDSPSLTFVQLPPGYGKTAIPFSLALWSILNEEVPIERSIHVLPLRSIVEDISGRFSGYKQDTKGELVGLKALGICKEDVENICGAQCMFIHESPFLQKNGLIGTTLDTFTLLACKIPVVEISKISKKRELYGHYEIARGAILSSTIIFDEAHLFFEEHKGLGRASEALIALIIALLEWHVPIIMMTATLPRSLRKEIIEWVKEYVPKVEFNVFEYGSEVKVDRDFESEIHSVNLGMEFEKDEENYINLIQQAYESYERVLVVTNTIRRSIDLFNKLENKGIKPILLHSKFTQKDRKDKLEKIGKNRKWLCISTQVIEAGIDISSNILFSDIAPICSIIQRAGRCCRPSHSYSETGKVIICVSKSSINAAKKVYDEGKIEATYRELTNITDKAFNLHSYSDYFPLINKIYNEAPNFKFGYTFNSILNIFEDPYYESTDALDYLLELGSFTRNSLLIRAIVCEDYEIKSLEDLQKKSELYIPIEEDELKVICKKSKVGVLLRKKDNEIEEIPIDKMETKNIAKYMITGEVLAIRINREIYDEERGLRLWF